MASNDLLSVTESGSRIEQLKVLARQLAGFIDGSTDEKNIAAIAKQYRETIKEIEELEGALDDGDEIEAIRHSSRSTNTNN